MKITLVQQEIVWGDKQTNLARFGSIAGQHYGSTDLLVLPEMFSTGFYVNSPELSEHTDGEAIRTVKRWAKEGNFAVTGSLMATDGNRYYNRGFFCQPDGNIAFADKRHLFIGDEKTHFTAGNTMLNITFRGVRFRVLICYDLRFPVWSRNAGTEYDVLIYVANWPEDRIAAWDTLLLARAIENQAYVCGVNAVGKDAYNIHHNGHSRLIDGRGKILVDFAENETAARTGEISLEQLQKIRSRFPFLNDADRFELLP
jgi:predicted amidohydrolase